MKKYYAEALGTFVLTFLGCGAAASLNCGEDAASVVGTAIAFGLAVVAMAYTIGGISGCHINPAITLGCLLDKRMSAKDACGYWDLGDYHSVCIVNQCSGAGIANKELVLFQNVILLHIRNSVFNIQGVDVAVFTDVTVIIALVKGKRDILESSVISGFSRYCDVFKSIV